MEAHNSTLLRKRRETFPWIDIFRLIAALLVVCNHCNPFTPYSNTLSFLVQNWASRFPVPFFFATGAYFCFKKHADEPFDIRVTNRYALKMLLMYAVWFALYNIPTVIHGRMDLFVGVKSFSLGFVHLWYLNAAAFAFFFVGVLFRSGLPFKVVFLITAVLYAVGLMGETYYGLFFGEDVSFYLYSSRNGLFYAPIYILIGMLLARDRIKIKLSLSFAGALIFSALSAGEVILCHKLNIAREYNMNIFMVPAIFFGVHTLLHTKLSVPFPTGLLRKMSTHIYLVHLVFLKHLIPIGQRVFSSVLGTEVSLNAMYRYVITIAGSIGVSFVLIWLQKQKAFRWLKYIT